MSTAKVHRIISQTDKTAEVVVIIDGHLVTRHAVRTGSTWSIHGIKPGLIVLDM